MKIEFNGNAAIAVVVVAVMLSITAVSWAEAIGKGCS